MLKASFWHGAAIRRIPIAIFVRVGHFGLQNRFDLTERDKKPSRGLDAKGQFSQST
jgi:hypothetical protein